MADLPLSEAHAQEAELLINLGRNTAAWSIRADRFAEAQVHATLAVYYQNRGA